MMTSRIGTLVFLLLTSAGLDTFAADAVTLVEGGQAKATIILADPDHVSAAEAALELQTIVEDSTSIQLPIVAYADLARLPAEQCRIFVGWRDELAPWFNLPDESGPETSIRIVNQHGVLLAGDDAVGDGGTAAPSPSTAWAVHQFLRDVTGVRWLWPGTIGTYVPRHDSLAIPYGETIHQPDLEQRQLRILLNLRPEPGRELLTEQQRAQLRREAKAWANHHGMGNRSPLQFGHAFTRWWPRYHEKHPDYFAVPLAGFKQPYPNERRVKLNLGNPAVVEQIVQEWIAAGKPSSWNVSPNDGSGFCVGEASRAMDEPPNQSPEKIWRGGADLSARYVKFWNAILRGMHKHRPDATITTYAYSAYRTPPQGLSLEPGMVIQVVDAFNADARGRWTEWSDRGAQLMLRPNWWHTGAIAPYIPLEPMGEFFKFVRDHGMIGFDFDSILGNWSTQGLSYYCIARMSQDKSLSVEGVIGEYTEAFGAAKPVIREYIRYWERFSEEADYTIPAGGIVAQNPSGRYERLLREHNLSVKYPLTGGWEVIPYLYTDGALAPAFKLLERAEVAAAQDPPIVRERIAFLRAGLDHLVLTRDALALAMNRKRSPDETAQLGRLFAELKPRRRAWTMQHIVWGEVLHWIEDKYKIAMVPARAHGGEDIVLDGL